jgi:hypothetical protein
MKNQTIIGALCLLLGVLVFPVLDHADGQPPAGQDAAVSEPLRAPRVDVAIPTLKTLAESIDELKQQVHGKEEELQLVKTESQKVRLLKELAELNGRVEILTRDFEQIATGVNLETFKAKPKEHFDWREQLQDVLGPIIKELQNMTAHPREIERLRGDAAYFEKQMAVAKGAIQNAQRLTTATQDQELLQQLQGVEKEWRQKEQQLLSQLAVVNYQLNEKLKEQKPFLESFQTFMKAFFKSRGRNLLLAFAAFILVVVLCRFLNRIIYRFSPLHKSGERTFYTRLTDLLYYVVTFAGATGASLLVLYLSGDWVLLSLAALFLLGLFWTARQTLPKFLTEAKFLLNLGTVREDERVFYHGIPWKVKSLNFSTLLVNPDLKGGTVRLPLHELMDLRSRPYEPDEPWFPCRETEWVTLADGTLGQVVMQTPEMVEVTLLGGSRKTYPTAEFLKQHPTNISMGFRLSTTFRLDYRHQRESTREIPGRLQEAVRRELSNESFAKKILNVGVEFKEAQPSSLDLAILVDVGGKAGRHYDRISRLIPRIAVEVSHEHGWVIPYPQVTLHTGDPADDAEDDSPSQTKGRRRWGFWKKN